MTPRSFHALALCLAVLPSCGRSGGGESTAADPTKAASSTTEASSTGSTTAETGADTVETTGTTGEPKPLECAGVAVPEPVNTVVSMVWLVHIPDDKYYISFSTPWCNECNSMDLSFKLGPHDPVVGTVPGLEYFGEFWLGEGGSSIAGTATIEWVALGPDCAVGRVSEVLEDSNEQYVLDALPGGFFATRATH